MHLSSGPPGLQVPVDEDLIESDINGQNDSFTVGKCTDAALSQSCLPLGQNRSSKSPGVRVACLVPTSKVSGGRIVLSIHVKVGQSGEK